VSSAWRPRAKPSSLWDREAYRGDMNLQTLAFGPVPSRRLGQSLGINNIPAKTCTYSCIYCQLGRTTGLRSDRCPFYSPEKLEADVKAKAATAREAGERVDYLAFVSDGEPTLDIHLGEAIDRVKTTRIKTAVISNASLVGLRDVRDALSRADWVSLKVDAMDESVWRRIDRPHKDFRVEAIHEGILAFAERYEGVLATETMLVGGVNDTERSLHALAGFLSRVQPARAYLAIPTRPPAEIWAVPPTEPNLNRAYQILDEAVERVEYLAGYEGNTFATTGDVQEDLLGIAAVHPLREDALEALLARAGADWETVRRLLEERLLVEVEYRGRRFYVRRLSGYRRPRKGRTVP